MPTDKRVTIDIPNVEQMSDEAVARLAWGSDGRWNSQTKALMAQFKATKLDLNLPWARTWTGWQCPSCKRDKLNIARLSRSGVLRCKLERHHDHLEDLVRRIFDDENPSRIDDSEYNQQINIAKNAIVSLAARFSRTLICSDCNSAEAEIKKSVEGVGKHFTFSPSEIGTFIKPTSNRSHELNIPEAQRIWEAKRNDFEDRVDFARRMARRFANGKNRQEIATSGREIPFQDAHYYWAQIGHMEPSVLENSLANQIEKRSISRDGDGLFTAGKPKPKSRPPTDDEFIRIEQRLPPATKEYWVGLGDSWRCQCCGRNKREICRLSKRKEWTAKIHKIQDWVEETDPLSLDRRRLVARSSLIIREHIPVYICQDCRNITTKLERLHPGTSGDILTARDISNVLVSVTANADHLVDYEKAFEIARDKQDMLVAVADYQRHRELSWDTSSRFMRRTKFGNPEKEVLKGLAKELAEKGRVRASHSLDDICWLIEEGKRFKEISKAERAIAAS